MINEILCEGKVSLKALITKCDASKTNKGVPYLSLLLEDKAGVLDAKFWNLTDEMVAKYHVGQIVFVKGDIILHKNAKQLRVQTMEILENENVLDYVRESIMEKEEMKQEIEDYIQNMKDESIKIVVSSLLSEHDEAFYVYPAAVRNHHNFVGGLAYHTLCMLRMAKGVVSLYPWLDSDLLYGGILLHDIAKIKEYTQAVLPEYSVEGNLLGHISMSASMIDQEAIKHGLEGRESITLLKHMVLSHHGKLEYGSCVLPMIAEAEVLATLDNLDARLYMFKETIDGLKPGTFSQRVYPLDSRMLYRRKEKE